MARRQSSRARKRGLTLMELVVVMGILVALAGIIIPLIPGMIGRAETSSRATNNQEIYKAIQTFDATYSHYPSDWDALSDGTTTPLTYVGGFTGTTPALQFTALDTAQIAALTAAGITRVQLMADGPFTPTTNETFLPYQNTTDRAANGLTVANGISLVTLTDAGQQQVSLSDNATTSSGTYVVFGFGKWASIVGTGVDDAPTVFFDNFKLSPDTRYSRYGIVFQVSGTDGTGSGTIIDYARARFVRVIRFGSTLTTGDDAINSYWQDVTEGGGS